MGVCSCNVYNILCCNNCGFFFFIRTKTVDYIENLRPVNEPSVKNLKTFNKTFTLIQIIKPLIDWLI